MRFHGIPWGSMRFYDVPVNRSVPTEANRGLTAYKNKLLHHENNDLMCVLEAKKNHKKKSTTMDLQQRREYHSGAVFWSPRKLCKNHACEAIKQDEDKRKQLQETQLES
jgi:hypothetical protein